MFTILLILIIIVSIMLTLVVLAQASKGDGLSGGLGAPGSIGTVFGVRRASDFLVNATISLAGAFMLLALITNLFFIPGGMDAGTSPIQSGPAPVPSAPARAPQSAPAVQVPVQQAPPSAPATK